MESAFFFSINGLVFLLALWLVQTEGKDGRSVVRWFDRKPPFPPPAPAPSRPHRRGVAGKGARHPR